MHGGCCCCCMAAAAAPCNHLSDLQLLVAAVAAMAVAAALVCGC